MRRRVALFEDADEETRLKGEGLTWFFEDLSMAPDVFGDGERLGRRAFRYYDFDH